MRIQNATLLIRCPESPFPRAKRSAAFAERKATKPIATCEPLYNSTFYENHFSPFIISERSQIGEQNRRLSQVLTREAETSGRNNRQDRHRRNQHDPFLESGQAQEMKMGAAVNLPSPEIAFNSNRQPQSTVLNEPWQEPWVLVTKGRSGQLSNRTYSRHRQGCWSDFRMSLGTKSHYQPAPLGS